MVIAENIIALTLGTFSVDTHSFMSGMCHADGDKLIFYVLAFTSGVSFYMWCMFPHVLKCIVGSPFICYIGVLHVGEVYM